MIRIQHLQDRVCHLCELPV
ncbi:hypothetical protein CP082626L3_1602, partial [Chlamydia psittaci 08-2626_L3]